MVLQSNIDKLGLVACEDCGTFEYTLKCDTHYPEIAPESFTHFLIQGKWYVLPQKFTSPLLSLVAVETAMSIQGAMCIPVPKRVTNLTEFFSLLRKAGVSEEQMTKCFPVDQVSRMKGRVFKHLVKGR